MNYQELEAAYIDAAGELRSKESSLSNVEPELGKFLHLRDCLREHPEFGGFLPKTFYSGGYLDPVGVKGEEGNDAVAV